MLKPLQRDIFCSKYPPSVLGKKMKGLVYSNLEDLYPTSCPQKSFLVFLILALVPSGGWSRWRWRGPWPVLRGQTGEHHDQSPRPQNLLIDKKYNDIPTSAHTPLKMNLLLPQMDDYNLRHTTTQAKNNRFLAGSKTTYQNSSAPPHKNLQPCLNILSLNM